MFLEEERQELRKTVTSVLPSLLVKQQSWLCCCPVMTWLYSWVKSFRIVSKSLISLGPSPARSNFPSLLFNYIYKYIFIAVYLLYHVSVSAVQQCGSAICIHMLPPSWSSLPSSPRISPFYVITEQWVELLVLHSSFPLAIYFTRDSVYMSSYSLNFSHHLLLCHIFTSSSPTSASLLLPCK